MRRISLALALMGAAAVGCSGGNKAPSDGTGTAKGVTGQYYYVNFFSPPIGGVVTSDVGGISCGASAVTLTTATPPQYAYTYYTGANACGTAGQTQFQWAQTVTLTAVPQGTNVFLGWAGDCSGYAPCVLSAGADKTVVAIFGTAGGGHPNFSNPALHGPAYSSSALTCTNCHGPTLAGQGIAPSCATCHANPGPQMPPSALTVRSTGLVAQILSVTPAATTNTVVTFSLKDGAGANVDLTGADGKNLPMPVTMGIMNFGTDAGGNVLPFKNATGGNPATASPYAAITSMSVTSGTWPSATAFTYPDGALTKGGVACTTAAPCTCAASPANCVVTGTSGFQAGRACTVAAPCTCSTANPCGPALPTTNGQGMLTRNATTGVYTYTFVANPMTGGPLGNTHTAWLATYRRENLANYVDGKAYKAVNVQFNFDANTGSAVAAKREIVSDAACAKCHDGFQAKAAVGTGDFHSSARVNPTYCNVCHYEGRGTNGFADSATFVHRIHAGKDLTQVTSGNVVSPYYQGATSCSATTPCVCTAGAPCSLAFHGMTATYPQSVANCAECHTPAAKGDQFKTRPTIAACGSCHDTLAATFLPVGTASITNHPSGDPQTRTNADCAGCHTAASIVASHIPVAPPAADNCFSLNNVGGCNNNTNASYVAAAGQIPTGADVITYDVQSVGTWLDGAIVRPQVVFKLLRNGADVDFGTYAAGTNEELIPGFVGGPSVYAVWGVSQDGITAPADFNASASIWLKSCWRAGTGCTLTRDAGTGYYTAQFKAAIIPASATMLTGGVGYTYGLTATQPLTQVNLAAFPAVDTNVTAGTVNFGGGSQTCTAVAPCVVKVGGIVVPPANVTKVATGFTGRRAIVANDKCNACHASLGVEPTFHAGQRNDAPTCSWCHNPNRTSSAWAANSAEFIHGIHGGEKRTVAFNWHAACTVGATWNAVTKQCERAGVAEEPMTWFPEVEYPGKLSDCTQCHVDTAYAFAGVDVSVLLWKSVATGAFAPNQMSTSPYVVADGVTSYGTGFSYSNTTGLATQAAATTLVSSPIAAACFSCHDTATARSHMEAAGGWIYKARGAGFNAAANTEACLDCHGAGKVLGIDKVHY